jgi:hypothetical protein
MNETSKFRRRFLGGLVGLWAAQVPGKAQSTPTADGEYQLPEYACRQNYQSLKQSSWDQTGGNSDRWPIDPGETKEVFNASGPGVISHIWFTIAASSTYHLKEIVLRIYWDGNSKPSVEVPVGDFFCLNLGI